MTNWSMAANWLSYLVLVWAHILNNDFGMQVYVAPSKVDDTKRPYYLWAAATGLYEYSITASWSVLLVFCCLEYPFMRISGFWETVSIVVEIAGFGMHMIPQILQMLEWRHSSIPI